MEEKPLWDPIQVRKAVLKETLQHPVTLLSASGAVLTSLYIALISGSKEGLLIALASMGLSVGSWVFNYFFRLDHFIQKYYKKWKKEVENKRKKQLEGLRQQLVGLKFSQGINAYDELKSAYDRFNLFLINSKSGVMTNLQKVQMEGIAGETYDLGMKAIEKMIALMKIVRTIDVERFKIEVKELDHKIKSYHSTEASSESTKRRVQSLEKRKLAILSRIESYRNALLEIEELLTRAEECENSIENSILQMPVFSDKIDDQQLHKALSAMETTVEAARRVSKRIKQGELDSSGREHPDDDLYLEAGRKI